MQPRNLSWWIGQSGELVGKFQRETLCTRALLQPAQSRMSNLPNTIAPDPTGSQPRSVNAKLKRIFVGEHGIRSGWSVLLFAAIFWILQTAVLATLRHFMPFDDKAPIPWNLAIRLECCQVLVVAAATLVMARIEGRHLLSYGFSGDGRLMRLLSGVLIRIPMLVSAGRDLVESGTACF